MKKEQARTIITVACQMLDHSRRMVPAAARGLFNLGDDCYVLLDDATKLFCEAASAARGERGANRWTSALPKLLYEHPEKCDEILALVEKNDFCGISAL
jgi:hypothetical protein